MRNYVKLYSVRRDGSRIIDHVLVAMESGQVAEWPKEYKQPVPPEIVRDVWEWYWDLRAATEAGFAGPQPVKYSEVKAWSDLMKIPICPEQVRYLRIMDSEYLNISAKENKATTRSTPAKRPKKM